jgi:alkylation response protein AidB-like acyl-CoA dehydrogenase
MTGSIRFANPPRHDGAERLRAEVREFLQEQLSQRTPQQKSDSWNGWDKDFSRALGARGWLGMTWPKAYGGHERSAFERYVIVEETLAAGAPVGALGGGSAEWPLRLSSWNRSPETYACSRHCLGELTFCIGMSEPGFGSEPGRRGPGRTAPLMAGRSRNQGLDQQCASQRLDDPVLPDRKRGRGGSASRDQPVLVDLRKTAGITVRPIIDLAGQHHFNEVHFEGAVLPADALLAKKARAGAR